VKRGRTREQSHGLTEVLALAALAGSVALKGCRGAKRTKADLCVSKQHSPSGIEHYVRKSFIHNTLP
jgi:hypothetical protein